MLEAQRTVHALSLQRWWAQPLEERLCIKGPKTEQNDTVGLPPNLLTIFFRWKSSPFLKDQAVVL